MSSKNSLILNYRLSGISGDSDRQVRRGLCVSGPMGYAVILEKDNATFREDRLTLAIN